MDRAAEEMSNGVTVTLALWADGVGGEADAVAVFPQEVRVSRAQLSKRRSLGTREITFRLINLRRPRFEDGVGIEVVDDLVDGVSVDPL